MAAELEEEAGAEVEAALVERPEVPALAGAVDVAPDEVCTTVLTPLLVLNLVVLDAAVPVLALVVELALVEAPEFVEMATRYRSSCQEDSEEAGRELTNRARNSEVASLGEDVVDVTDLHKLDCVSVADAHFD